MYLKVRKKVCRYSEFHVTHATFSQPTNNYTIP